MGEHNKRDPDKAAPCSVTNCLPCLSQTPITTLGSPGLHQDKRDSRHNSVLLRAPCSRPNALLVPVVTKFIGMPLDDVDQLLNVGESWWLGVGLLPVTRGQSPKADLSLETLIHPNPEVGACCAPTASKEDVPLPSCCQLR